MHKQVAQNHYMKVE